MIHWAWLIVAFYGGAISMWVFGWLALELWNRFIYAPDDPALPLEIKPAGIVSVPEGVRYIHPKQPPDSTKPDLKRPPRIQGVE